MRVQIDKPYQTNPGMATPIYTEGGISAYLDNGWIDVFGEANGCTYRVGYITEDTLKSTYNSKVSRYVRKLRRDALKRSAAAVSRAQEIVAVCNTINDIWK